MWIFLLLFSNCIFSMERENSIVVVTNSASAAAATSSLSSSNSSIDSFSSPEEKDELYLRALYTVYPMGYDEVNERLKSYLDQVIIEESTSPDNRDGHLESNVSILRRLRSGDIQEYHEQYIKKMVMKATSQAFQDQQENLDLQRKKVEEQQRKLESKFSKSSTATIALISSIVTSVASVLIAIYSQK